jgi:hypothetical protein
VAQVLELLPSKCEALTARNPAPVKKKKKKYHRKNERIKGGLEEWLKAQVVVSV